MARPDAPEPLTMGEAIIPVAALIVLVALSFYLFGDAGAAGPNQVALAVASLIGVYIGWRRGHSLDSLRAAAVESVGSGVGAIFILLAVGSLIGTWAMSGTLIAMVYYGLQLLDPNFFYLTACALCGVVSFSIGSSWTTVGTIGVGLMGIAINMELNPAITAGAVISGAYLGDTTSPLSDSANLAAATAGLDLYRHVKEMALTSLPAFAIALCVFFFLGRPGDFDSSAKLRAIEDVFVITPWLFLPLLVVVGLALLRFPPFTSIFLGALVGGVLAAVIAPDRVIRLAGAPEGMPDWLAIVKGVWLALSNGYTSNSGHATVDTLVSRGGMASMLNTVWLIITALAYGGVVEKAGVLDRLIAPVLAAAKSTTALVGSLVGAVFTTNVVTADQYISIVLPGRMFKGAFEKRGYAPMVLSRTIAASGTPTSAVIPWNSCGAYMAATLGVATFSYLPYAVFNLVSPLLVIAMSFLGVRMFRVASAPSH